ncbi:MAG: NTPase [Candidatus Bathyarchaeia archaeon]
MASCRIFLTGQPNSGKTTAVRKICDLLNCRGKTVGGMISGEIRQAGTRVGFMLEDVANATVGVLAHVNIRQGPRVGRYGVNFADISRVGVTAIVSALSSADVVVIDEIGPMELCSPAFVDAIRKALRSPKPLVGTIHRSASHPMIKSIKTNQHYEILEVTTQNREQVPFLVEEKLSEADKLV